MYEHIMNDNPHDSLLSKLNYFNKTNLAPIHIPYIHHPAELIISLNSDSSSNQMFQLFLFRNI